MHDCMGEMSASAKSFVETVWPCIAEQCGGGDIRSRETVTHDCFSRELDLYAGIDGWQVHERGLMRAIASRVQPIRNGHTFNTFTIRYQCPSGKDTEWHKRLIAIRESERGWLHPHLTVQAYVSDTGNAHDRYGDLLIAAIIRTGDLVDYVEPRLASAPRTWQNAVDKHALYLERNSIDKKIFIVVPWMALQHDGIRLAIVTRPQANQTVS